MPYNIDRGFSDKVHNNLAVKIIYPLMAWTVHGLNERLLLNIDQNNAVDYVAIDQREVVPRIVTIQERFRENKFRSYSDFTIRYMRPENIHEERRESEFFKLDADYFIYGIINTSKKDVDNATDFIKFAVLNLNVLRQLIDEGTVVIDPNLDNSRCERRDNVMHCPINENSDHSSNFVPLDINILYEIEPRVIEYQRGFIRQ